MERNENSVLTSLKDLRRIEDDRMRREEEALRARDEAERLARLEAERLARLEVERRVREEREAELAVEEARRREEREEKLRLAQAETTARIEAEARLEAERMRLEMDHAPAGGRRLRGVLLGLLAVLLLAGGGMTYLFAVHLPAEARKREEAEQARLRAIEEKAERERKALMDRLSEQEKRLQGAIANARSAAEVDRLRAQLDTLKKEQAEASARQPPRRGRYVRLNPRPVRAGMERPPMKPDPNVRNNALRGLFGDD